MDVNNKRHDMDQSPSFQSFMAWCIIFSGIPLMPHGSWSWVRWKPPRRFRSRDLNILLLLNIHFRCVTIPNTKKPPQHLRPNLRWVAKTQIKSAVGWKGNAGDHLQRLRCYRCCREQPDLHHNHFKPPCAIHSPSCNFETLSLPRNFSAGYFSFALTQNEPQLLAGSTHTIPHVDGLRQWLITASISASKHPLHRSLAFLPKLESYP